MREQRLSASHLLQRQFLEREQIEKLIELLR